MDTHRDAVWRFCLFAAGEQEAEDCFQETFLAALRAYPRLRHTDALRAWVLKIAGRKVVDAHRSRSRRPRPTDDLPEAAVEPEPMADEALWGLVGGLPPKQRIAVAHRFVGDLTYRDIAEAMSCTEEAARRNVHEGVRKLREALGA